MISIKLKHSSTGALQSVRAFFLISWIHLFNLLIKVISGVAPDSWAPMKRYTSEVCEISFKTPPFSLNLKEDECYTHGSKKKGIPYPCWKCFHLKMGPLLSGVMKLRLLEWFTLLCWMLSDCLKRWRLLHHCLHHSKSPAEDRHKSTADITHGPVSQYADALHAPLQQTPKVI